ncbi:MAG: DUF4145 domain-containing protein [Pseudomonadota bacterium]|nr:DUF4145 domain-containing protein [Pseudomonadota bacterium]
MQVVDAKKYRNKFKNMNIKESWFDFSKSNPPDWDCPTCKKGVLNFHEKDLILNETSASIKLREIDVHEPEWIEYGFSAKLTCSNSRCNEVVMMIGDGRVDWVPVMNEAGHPEQKYGVFFRPRYFQPNLQPIDIPERCPEYVQIALQEAFKVMFVNFELACNQLRVAVEYIVDDFLNAAGKAIQRKKSNGEPNSLHWRIKQIHQGVEYFESFLLAVKWIGNAGSHEVNVLKFQDFVDALGFIEEILNERYMDNRSLTRKERAIEINKIHERLKK